MTPLLVARVIRDTLVLDTATDSTGGRSLPGINASAYGSIIDGATVKWFYGMRGGDVKPTDLPYCVVTVDAAEPGPAQNSDEYAITGTVNVYAGITETAHEQHNQMLMALIGNASANGGIATYGLNRRTPTAVSDATIWNPFGYTFSQILVTSVGPSGPSENDPTIMVTPVNFKVLASL